MAITELQTPRTLSPAYNDMHFLVNSTNKAQDNFKYRFKVYVDGVYIGKTFKVSPDPDYGFGLFDAKRTIQTYLTHDIDLGTTGILAVENNNATYYISYGEEYGDLSSGVTTYDGLATSSTRYAFAGSLTSLNAIDYYDTDYPNYIMDSSGSMFLTNQPRPFRLFENQVSWLGMMDDTTSHIQKANVVTYNSSGAVIQTVTINNGNNQFLTDRFYRTISGYNLNNVPGSQISAGAQPIITDSVSYYTVQIFHLSNPISEIFRFDIDRSCDWDDSYDVAFMNVYGWFDTFRFTRSNTKQHDINAKYYKQSTGTRGASTFTVAKTDRAKTQYYTDFNDKWVLRSAYLTQEESTWLLELVTSPQVYIIVNSELIPVTITQSNYNERKRSEGEIFNLEITIEFSVKNYRQRY